MAADSAPSAFPQRQRRIVLAVFVALCLALIAGYYLVLRTDYAVLFAGLKPGDASAIVAELDAKGVPHRLRDQGTTILVPTDQTDAARLTVAGSDLPMKGAVGFELFNKSDMGLTDFAQKINYQRALQGELARTILSIDGIESARVHLALPDRSLYRQDRSTPKAAVEIVARSGHALTPDRVAGIQQLVASAVPDLPLNAVSVLDGDGRIISAAPAPQAITTPDSDERNAIQAYYSARARTAIAQQLPGLMFDVRTLVIGTDDVGDTALPATSAGQRNFQLRIAVVTQTALGAEEQGLARSAAAAAVGLDEARGDTLSFALGPVAAPRAAPVALETATATTAAPLPANAVAPMPDMVTPVLAALGGIGALILLAVFVLRRRRFSLSEPERLQFVERLRAELRLSEASDGAN